MEDVFVDIDDEVVDVDDVCDLFVDGDDEFVDPEDGINEYIDRDDVPKKRIIRHDVYGRIINDKPSDYVSFRFSRFDREEGHPVLPNPVMERFRYFQSEIKNIKAAKMPMHTKKVLVHRLRSQFAQELRSMNIRYRNLWRHLDTYGILPKMHW